MNETTLEINLNEEYKIKIEEGKFFDNSIFKDVYKEALRSVIEIVRHSEIYKKSKYDDFNNIIAFTGERGKGKSSSMISFKNALANKECDENYDFFQKHNDREQYLKDKIFADIDIIDPSLFKENEGLFEIVLAKMFEKFQDKMQNQNDFRANFSDADRRQLIECFQKVFKNLQIINSDRKELYKKDSIEALSKLATSSNLREDFKKLVEFYLEKFENKKSYLLIAIDDFDLNISNSYDMLEDIRRFLIQKKIILLIACKMEQLHEAIYINYKKKLIEEDIKGKSKKYLDKLIPFNRRLFLPNVQEIDKIEFKIILNKDTLFNITNNNFRKSILDLLFARFGLIQTYNKLGKNFIIPETIRETQNFVNAILSSERIRKLKDYLIDEIDENTVYQKTFFELENVSDDLFLLMSIKKIINLYLIKIPNILDKFNDSEKSIQFRKLYNATIANTISLGDIYFLIKEYEDIITIDNYDEIKFLDFFKIYFSLRILKNNNLTKLGVTKFGFVNNFFEILPKDNNIQSRDFFTASNLQSHIFSLYGNERFILSLFSLYLGGGYHDYRKDLDKDIFVQGYNDAILSPFAIFHNLYNIDILSNIFDYQDNSEFIINNLKWFEESHFIKQLYNPSFTLELFDLIKEFRLKEIKETLPSNYFDTICLLFIYGIIYALDKIENEYKIHNLVSDFIQFPIIKCFLAYFQFQEYNYKIVNELNTRMGIWNIVDTEIGELYDLKDAINSMYLYTKEQKLSNGYKLSNDVKYILIELLKLLRRNKDFTSKTIDNRIKKLKDYNNTSEIIEILNARKLEFNSNDFSVKTNVKNDLQRYINNLLLKNG